MAPSDVEAFVKLLEEHGLKHLEDGKAVDMVIIEQLQGHMAVCDWLEYGKIPYPDAEHRVVVARLRGGESEELKAPEGWKYEKSLSATYIYVPHGKMDDSMKFIRHEGNQDVYLNLMTNKEVYIGRTYSLHQPV